MQRRSFASLRMTCAVFLIVWALCGCGSTAPSSGNGDGSGNDNGNNNGNGNGDGGTALSISGTITGTAAASATVTLSGAAAAETTTDASGNYSFSNLAAGDYTVTPSKANSAFNPANSAVTVDGAEDADFASAAYQTAAIASTTTLDGTVNECVGGDLGTDATGRVGKEGAAGDCLGADRRYRTYFSFDLSGSGVATTATIVSATLSFRQVTTAGAPYTGNALTIDHVNYGDALMTDDWNTARITDPAITNTTATNGVVTISTDLKDYVQSDVGGRRRTQVRLSFPDGLAAGNYITIERGNGVADPPTLTVTYYQFQ